MFSKIYKRITEDDCSCLALIGAVLVIAILFIIFNAIAVWLWGIIAVGVFGLPALNFWQMLGLKLLLRWLIPMSSGGYTQNG